MIISRILATLVMVLIIGASVMTAKHASTPQIASGVAGVFLFVMIWFMAFVIPTLKK